MVRQEILGGVAVLAAASAPFLTSQFTAPRQTAPQEPLKCEVSSTDITLLHPKTDQIVVRSPHQLTLNALLNPKLKETFRAGDYSVTLSNRYDMRTRDHILTCDDGKGIMFAKIKLSPQTVHLAQK